jgi:signal transduction histidine kinase
MPEPVLKVLILVLSLVAHLVALFQFHLVHPEKMPFYPKWLGQFHFLLALSMLLAVLMWRFRDKPGRLWMALITRSGILVLIGMPFGGYLGIELTLLGVVIIETLTYGTLWKGIAFSLLLTGVMAGSQQAVVAWGHALPAASPHDQLSLIMYGGLLIVTSAVIRYQLDNQVSSAELNRCLDETTLQLAQANLQLQEYAMLTEQEAKENERKRLAREMHDTLSYTLTNLLMMLEAAIDLSAKGGQGLLTHLERARDQAKAGLAEVRGALQALRPVQMEEESGLVAIYHLVQTFAAATRIHVELNFGDVPLHFGEEADWAAYRLVQEGMTNALRHGKATLIEISMSLKDGGANIRIKDNGQGLNEPVKEGYGLLGMRERIERLGGNLTFENDPKRGFVLSAWIPLKVG